jgi:hypothetical protein
VPIGGLNDGAPWPADSSVPEINGDMEFSLVKIHSLQKEVGEDRSYMMS